MLVLISSIAEWSHSAGNGGVWSMWIPGDTGAVLQLVASDLETVRVDTGRQDGGGWRHSYSPDVGLTETSIQTQKRVTLSPGIL